MRRCLSAMVLAAAVAALAAAQEAPGKAPRAVYFAPAQSTAVLDSEGTTLLDGMPEMLATSIAARQPFARSMSAEAARSVVTVAAAPAADGRVKVTIALLEDGAAKTQVARDFGGRSLGLAPLQGLIDDAASRFTPLLGPVDAETDIQRLTARQEFVQTVREASGLEQLDKRWEFSLWMSGLLRLIDNTGMDSSGSYYFGIGLGPLIAEATWFFSRDLGVQVSMYFNQSSSFDFGSHSRYHASGIFIFPGVGFVYRTVGQISAEYAITLSAGWVYVKANEGDVKDKDSTVVIPQGSSAWSSISARVRFSPALVWCITPAIALKTAIALDMIFPKLFPWYDSPLGDLQFLSIGVAYRL